MGQARRRGTFAQRKSAAIQNKREQERLDRWLESHQHKPFKNTTNHLALMVALTSAFGPGFEAIPVGNQLHVKLGKGYFE